MIKQKNDSYLNRIINRDREEGQEEYMKYSDKSFKNSIRDSRGRFIKNVNTIYSKEGA